MPEALTDPSGLSVSCSLTYGFLGIPVGSFSLPITIPLLPGLPLLNAFACYTVAIRASGCSRTGPMSSTSLIPGGCSRVNVGAIQTLVDSSIRSLTGDCTFSKSPTPNKCCTVASYRYTTTLSRTAPIPWTRTCVVNLPLHCSNVMVAIDVGVAWPPNLPCPSASPPPNQSPTPLPPTDPFLQ